MEGDELYRVHVECHQPTMVDMILVNLLINTTDESRNTLSQIFRIFIIREKMITGIEMDSFGMDLAFIKNKNWHQRHYSICADFFLHP